MSRADIVAELRALASLLDGSELRRVKRVLALAEAGKLDADIAEYDNLGVTEATDLLLMLKGGAR